MNDTATHLTETRFSEFDLPQPLLDGLADAGFEFCTPIQAKTLPLLLKGEDVAGQAQTGTGKTAAFLLATMAHLLRHEPSAERKISQPRAIVLAPTRELAIQIASDAEALAGKTEFKTVLVYGGTGYEQQREKLSKGADIIIGTPGRIIDYFKQGVFDLSRIEVAVLDEADRMFDLGFIKDIRYLFRSMPEAADRLNMLFSATLSHRVNELAYESMAEPVSIKVDAEQLTADNITECVYYPSNDEKIPLLVSLLRESKDDRTLVFVNTRFISVELEAWLAANGIPCAVLSGDVPQKKRERLLQAFKDGKVNVLVATDVAARGLHISNVSHVINFDLPQDAEDYVHRIGRTARAGASGHAHSFACERYAFSLADIESYIGHKLPVTELDSSKFLELDKPKFLPRAEDRRPSSGRRNGGGRAPARGGRERGPRASTARSGPSQPPRNRGPRPEKEDLRPDATPLSPNAANRSLEPEIPAVG